jgi:hypothetical protein
MGCDHEGHTFDMGVGGVASWWRIWGVGRGFGEGEERR